jgi:hypothetical protein
MFVQLKKDWLGNTAGAAQVMKEGAGEGKRRTG